MGQAQCGVGMNQLETLALSLRSPEGGGRGSRPGAQVSFESCRPFVQHPACGPSAQRVLHPGWKHLCRPVRRRKPLEDPDLRNSHGRRGTGLAGQLRGHSSVGGWQGAAGGIQGSSPRVFPGAWVPFPLWPQQGWGTWGGSTPEPRSRGSPGSSGETRQRSQRDSDPGKSGQEKGAQAARGHRASEVESEDPWEQPHPPITSSWSGESWEDGWGRR